jgi:hypothetical protein
MTSITMAPRLRGGRSCPVTAAAQKFCEANESRLFVGITVVGAGTVYLGFSDNVTAENGWPITAATPFLPPVPFSDEIWLITTATATALLLEG